MKNKNYIKLLLDIVIALVFTLLFNTRVLGGMPFHEIAGLGIGLGFLVHILLNSQWVKKVTLRVFDRELPAKTRFGYFLNVLLLIAIIVIIVSGLMISKVIFPGLRSADQRWFRVLHLGISYLSLVIVGMHVGLHGQWIIGMMKKVFKVQSSSLTRVLAKVALVLVIFFGGSQILENQVAPRIAQMGTGANINSQQMPPEGFKGQIEGRGSDRGNYGAGLGGERSVHGEGFGADGSKGGLRSTNPSGVILIYSGILSVVAFITYYGEKVLVRRKVKP